MTAKKPSGVWIAVEETGNGFRFIGVFDTRDLAATACPPPGRYLLANIEPDRSYRNRAINWQSLSHLSATPT
ncbi:hypothetical protein [Rhodoblastus sp.]|uniref:hypothetical protein n=1 Tax=Rhodoblastus sp. TaxID=1962975 RepID=UPI003F9BA32B